MIWLQPSSLPPHCQPTNNFLLHFSQLFHVCIPTPLAFLSHTLGLLSILAWLFAQLPQTYKNYRLRSVSGLSIFFLIEWCLGDLSNLLGALFTHQASWQVAIGSYYVFVDLCLVGQWVWYEKLKHGRMVRMVWWRGGEGSGSGGGGMGEVIEGVAVGTPEQQSPGRPQDEDGSKQTKPLDVIFTPPRYGTPSTEKIPYSSSSTPKTHTILRSRPSTPLRSSSPRTLLLIACLAAITSASPTRRPLPPSPSTVQPTPLENAGTILSWLSTLLYLGSRLPQLLKNYRRKSTAGLSPHLFLAAFCGNLFYSSALLTNPRAWASFGPYGGGGWVGPEGSERGEWVAAALPFFLGAAGVLGLDASVGVQFLVYGEREVEKVVVVVEEEEEDGKGSRWRRVSGWMRGWVPGIGTSERKSEEREALLGWRESRDGGEGYGT